MVSERKYMVIKEGRVLGIFDDFADAFRSVIENKGGEIYRVELVSKLGSEEATSITEYILTEAEPVEVPLARKVEIKTIVFDPSFSLEEVEGIIERYLDLKFMLHSEKVASSKDHVNVLTYDVSDDDRIIDFLASFPQFVLFVTRSKRLYVKSSKLSNVKAIYISSGEDLQGKIRGVLGSR